MANCMATTAGIPRVTMLLEIPASASAAGRLALWHELSTTSRTVLSSASSRLSAVPLMICAFVVVALVLEDEHALLRGRVVIAVTDEVEDVIIFGAQTALKRDQRGRVEPFQLQQAPFAQRGGRFLKPLPFAFHVQRREILRRGDHHQHAQRHA